jgi:ApaG protein
MMETGYSKTTRGIEVTVQPSFLDDQSDPDENRFVWAYRVRIYNRGQETVQLMRRNWRIVDGKGQVTEVEGAGVVGEQPVLEAGDVFEYTSGTPLTTPSGFMQGSYRMAISSSGEVFDVAIPAFSLDCPQGVGPIH